LNQIYSTLIQVSNSSDYERKNAVEDWHAIHETIVLDIFEQLYRGDISFWDDDQGRAKFSAFIAFQYGRTPKMRISSMYAVKKIENLKNIDIVNNYNQKKIAKYFDVLLPELIGNYLYSRSKLILLVNNTGFDFITCDQPVYNIKANLESIEMPKEFELYYPISPQRALIFTENEDFDAKLTIEKVDNFNKFMCAVSEEQIYSNSSVLLEKYEI